MSKADEFFTWNMAFRHLVHVQGFSQFILKDMDHKTATKELANKKYGGDMKKLTDKEIKDIVDSCRDSDNIMRVVLATHHSDLLAGQHATPYAKYKALCEKFGLHLEDKERNGEALVQISTHFKTIQLENPSDFDNLEGNFTQFVKKLRGYAATASMIKKDYIGEKELHAQFVCNCGILRPYVENFLIANPLATFEQLVTACNRLFTKDAVTRRHLLFLHDTTSTTTTVLPAATANIATANAPATPGPDAANQATANFTRNGKFKRTRRAGALVRNGFGKGKFFGGFKRPWHPQHNRFNGFRKHGRFNNNPRFGRGNFGKYRPEANWDRRRPDGSTGHERFNRDERDPEDEGRANVTFEDLTDGRRRINRGNGVNFYTDAYPAPICLSTTAYQHDNYFVVDSGSSHSHVTDLRFTTHFQQNPSSQLHIVTAAGHTITTQGIAKLGDLTVYYMPEFRSNLLSVWDVVALGYTVLFTSKEVIFTGLDGHSIKGTKMGNLYYLRKDVATQFRDYNPSHGHVFDDSPQPFEQPLSNQRHIACPALPQPINNFLTWHARTHHNLEHLKKLAKNRIVEGLNLRLYDIEQNFSVCPHCALGKIRRKSYKKGRFIPPAEKLVLIYSDVKGPISPTGICGERYVVSFICAATKFKFAFIMKHKSDTATIFKEFYENWLHKHITARRLQTTEIMFRTIVTDGGGEYEGEFNRLCNQYGFRHTTTTPYTPELNGISENYWRTLFGLARCMLLQAHENVPIEMWPYAVTYANYILNRTLIVARGKTLKTPAEWFEDRKPDISHLRVFGSEAFVPIPDAKHNTSAVGPQARRCYFLGFNYQQINGAVFMTGPRDKIVIIKADRENCRWNEIIEPRYIVHSGIEVNNDMLQMGNLPEIPTKRSGLSLPEQMKELLTIWSNNRKRKHTDDSSSPSATEGLRRSSRLREKSRALLADLPRLDAPGNDLITTREALRRSDWPSWRQAIIDELTSIVANDVWKPAVLPHGRKALSVKWILKVKRDELGCPIKHKARLVIRGFEAESGIDFDLTYSPVAKLPSLRVFLSLVVQFQLSLVQLDVDTAFQNAHLDEEIYIELPEFYQFIDENGDRRHFNCLRLNRALYGLPQAPRNWFRTLDEFLRSIGYRPTASEPCLYLKSETDGTVSMLLVYVDDMLIAHSNPRKLRQVVDAFKARFKLKEAATIRNLLGMRVNYDVNSNIITLDCEHKINQLLATYKLQRCSPPSTPLPSSLKKLTAEPPFSTRFTDREMTASDRSEYRSLVGSLMYLANAVRPDISYATSQLARFISNPKWHHIYAAKHVLKYLAGTRSFKLIFRRSGKFIAIAYSDSDWATDKDTRRSQSGGCIFLGCNLVYWHSHLQLTVSLSSAEAELTAIRDILRAIIWLRNILIEIPWLPATVNREAATVFEDNQAAIHLAVNPESSSRTKHFDIAIKFIREHIQQLHTISLVNVKSEDNCADIFTKQPDSVLQFQKLVSYLFSYRP